MTNLASKTAASGESKERMRTRKYRALMAAAIGIAFIFSFVIRRIWPTGNRFGDVLTADFAITCAVFILLLGVCLAFLYHRIIDEQEERAALWGMTIGFHFLSFGGFAWLFLVSANLVPLFSFAWLLAGSITLAGAVQFWLQYR